MQGAWEAKPTLLIEQYNLKQDAPLANDADWTKIDARRRLCHRSRRRHRIQEFHRLSEHLNAIKLDVGRCKETATGRFLQSGNDLMETGFPLNMPAAAPTSFSYRRVNGAWSHNARRTRQHPHHAGHNRQARKERRGSAKRSRTHGLLADRTEERHLRRLQSVSRPGVLVVERPAA